ncbi:cell wall hydrolase [Parvularcula lutaonensis]|uniref:Cell wall hydrolase n=1 Tax=Parvularcula lutaonensis TaxID=491923 RepID=A0ABV7M877_9PROT|nr:cell wall hydrolase [Parvularcula lutaonensis]GGY43675.1 hypothetical protein GCM10007148_10570 [Parvularcula lutaonensis]
MTGEGETELLQARKPTKIKGLKRSLSLILVIVAVISATMLMSRQDEVVASVEVWASDIFEQAALERAEVPDAVVVSAIDLLDEAGFDGRAISTDLLLAGVPSNLFSLPNYSPFELSEEQKKERNCLAQAIYYEARNQPVLGRIAVADVVLNRVADRRFPSTICGVVFQGQGKSYGCQFSFACDGSLNRPREPRAWDRAEALADVIYRGFRPPLTNFATFYHADYVDPYWAKAFDQTRVIGDHIFFRPPGTLKLAANRLGIDLEELSS